MSSYIYKEPSLSYKVLTTLGIISFILFIILGGFFLAPEIGNIPFVLAILILLTVIIFLHSKNTAYICKNCNHEFEISFWQDLSSAHVPGKKMLKCPNCLYRDYATELVKIKNTRNV
jgi:DNA-directed RNA polymerase subunit RPC12/RpoP